MKRPYQPPELRRLELEQLTAEQRDWVKFEHLKDRVRNLQPVKLSLAASLTHGLLARYRK